MRCPKCNEPMKMVTSSMTMKKTEDEWWCYRCGIRKKIVRSLSASGSDYSIITEVLKGEDGTS